jgi:hypothetical protein
MTNRIFIGTAFALWLSGGSASIAGTGSVNVGSVAELRAAIAAATPGTVIELGEGSYDLAGTPVFTVAAGSAQAPIAIRAASRNTVIRTNGAEEAFLIAHPW